MAEAAADHDSEGSWEDDVPEDEEQGRALNREYARRADVLQQRTANGDWCTCGTCYPTQDALSAFDVTCCQESDEAKALCAQNPEFEDEEPYSCVTHHPCFYTYCLYEHGLNNRAHEYRMEGVNQGMVERHEKLRYVAYRSYTGWAHGFLGRRQRKEIPHCVQKAIRQRFKDPQARYTGFVPAELVDGPPPP